MNQIAKGEKVPINPGSPPPEIEVVIGSIAIGFYSSYLIKDSSHPLICKGSSAQPVKRCKISDNSATLPGCKVSWQVGLAGAAPNDLFNVTVTLMQDGNNLRQYKYNGQGDDLIVDYVTLV